MILHESTTDFRELIELTSEYFSLERTIIEKDYWVTKALHNLSKSELSGVAIFKGGTSLTKCYKDLHRFSEDIDIAIDTKGLNPGQIKKRLIAVENVMKGDLVEVFDSEFTDKKGIVRRTQQNYESCIESESSLFEMHPHIKFEIVGFTEPTPTDLCETKSFIYDYLVRNNLMDVIDQFNLGLFTLTVLRIDRTILEKMASLIRMSYIPGWEELSRKTRHLYDIFLTYDILEEFFTDRSQLTSMVEIVKRAELEYSFADKYPSKANWSDSPLLEALDSKIVQEGYELSFGKEFVFGELPSYDQVKKLFHHLFSILKDNVL